jgi:hypothetical protein
MICSRLVWRAMALAVSASIVAGLGCSSAAHGSASAYTERKGAPQLIYQHGVPHTDKNGRITFDLTSHSFFPRCGYESVPGTLANLRAAGFNCVKPWSALTLASVLQEAAQSDMQVIREQLISPCDFKSNPNCDPDSNAAPQIAAAVAQFAEHADDPGVLAWYVEEEPTGCVNQPSSCLERLTNYQAFRAAIRAVDPVHPSFNLDISLPYTRALDTWISMNSEGDIAANDDYPFHKGSEKTLESSAANDLRLVALTQQQKPVWITVQAFEQSGRHGFLWKMPTPTQLRAEVFTAIVHGATGIIYFALDSAAVRNAQVIGIASSPPPSYPSQPPANAVATSDTIAAAGALWRATARLNAELERLQKVILSRTATLSYQVATRGQSVTANPIRTLLKQGEDGRYTLLVVNIDAVALDLRIELARPPAELAALDETGAAVALQANGAAIAGSIEAFGVRIYQFK